MVWKDFNKRKEYYINNKEKIKKHSKEYYKNNKERMKDYYKKNKKIGNEKKREYRKKSEVKIKESKYQKVYRNKNKDKIKQNGKNFYLNNKEKKKEYYKNNRKKILKKQIEYRIKNQDKIKEYRKKPETRERENIKKKIRFKTDSEFNITIRLRSRLRIVLNNYLKTGKIMSSKKYGIDYKEIIEYLKPFPKDLSKYHIDHIKPLSKFKFINKDGSTNLEEIKKAFVPENHQWLLAEENLKKNNKWDGD